MLSEKFFLLRLWKGRAQHTSEHEALIRAAGSISDRKIDTTVALAFTRLSTTSKVFKNFVRFPWLKRVFKWWKEIIWANRGKILLRLWRRKRFLSVREKFTVDRCVRTAKHFLIGGRSFVHKIIHLPVLRSQQPIETQQERKCFSHVGFTHLLPPVNWVALFKILNQVFQFAFPVMFVPSFPLHTDWASKRFRQLRLTMKISARRLGKRKIFQRKKKQETLVKNITMIMIDDGT